MQFLLLAFLIANAKTLNVNYAEVAPRIDGVIEDLWHQADSALDFVQSDPYEKTIATEPTVVYALQDKDNLYFAFRCYAKQHKPTACLIGDEDRVAVGIDPFGSRTTGYYFIVYASEMFDDGWVLDDGRNLDNSWDGVWSRAVKLYDDRFEVELKIPFKTIRYKKGLQAWGVQFQRYTAANRETDFWTEVTETEGGDIVSKWPSLTSVNPQATGYYFELYPEGYVRYDKYAGQESKWKPNASLNLKWDITPQTTLNGTTFPDFAQIESDPFTLNLSRYPVHLSKRRPFFLEGKDVFRMSDFGEHRGFYQPLNIFYTRRIGKSMNGSAVPIIGGLKLTRKSEAWNFGLLGAYTNEYTSNDTVIEPRRGFGSLRIKRRVLGTSDIGMLFSSSAVDQDEYNYALGLDGVYRRGFNQLIVQGALSNNNRKQGWAVSSGFFGLVRNFLTIVSAEIVHDSFDVTDIGFVPWAGRKQIMIISGPFKNYPKGYLRTMFLAPGVVVVQEPGDSNWSTVGVVEINPGFRTNWGFDLSLMAGPYYEADTNYLYRSANLSLWGNLAGNFLNLSGNYSYTYNYRRDFLGNQASGEFSYRYSIIPQFAISLATNTWVEWDTANAVLATTQVMQPRIDLRPSAELGLGIFNSFVMEVPGTDWGKTDLLSNRLGMLLSWNFKPKSWLYIALNDFRERDLQSDKFQPLYRIAAVKAKYLIYF